MSPNSDHHKTPAAKAVHDLLDGLPGAGHEWFCDFVEQRPELLSDEAEDYLSDLINFAATARTSDDHSLDQERRRLERLRRLLRDCRANGVAVVRRHEILAPDVKVDGAGTGPDTVGALANDQTAMDWREGKLLLELGRVEEAVVYLKRAVEVMRERGQHGLVGTTEMALYMAVRGNRATLDVRAALVHAGNAAVAFRRAGSNAGLRKALTCLAIDSDLVEPGGGRAEHYLALLAETDADLATWLRSYLRGARLILMSGQQEGGTTLRWCMDNVHLVSGNEAVRAHWLNECARKLVFLDRTVVADMGGNTTADQIAAEALARLHRSPEVAAEYSRRALSLAEQERRSVVTEASQLAISANLAPIYDIAAEEADRIGQTAEALDLVELNTGRGLLSRLMMHRLWGAAETGESDQTGLKQQVIRYLSDVERGGGAGVRNQLHTALARLWEAVVADERAVLATTSRSRRIVAPVKTEQLTGHLRADDVVVVYASIGVIYTIAATGVRRVADLDLDEVERLCARYRRLACAPGDDADRAAADIEAACVDPVRADLTGYRRVFVVPAGPLWGVPLGALGTHPLNTDHLVTTVPSLSVLDHLLTRPHRPRRVERFAGIADPDGGLPHAAAELTTAAGHFYDHTSQVGPEIDAGALLADLPEADVVHIASHGVVFDAFPELTALHVAGTGRDRELLWAPDLVRLDLRARLVVLAACHAGLSTALPGNEYVGLPGVFLVAGAHTVLGPLWRVDDQVTARFMTHFYASLLDMGAAGALHHAQQQLKADPATSHPHYWAAFQLFGLS
ncbi:CHAT domain-containing protein [Lentzea sp.]|uniref:CHAT domain-containing protein n=1 Tax=Lentzea sp. TaxID=56099 RepID=UPI002ED4DD6E